jgi:SpoVK/Ycf46/Vps4 family AAA+-type ATPase
MGNLKRSLDNNIENRIIEISNNNINCNVNKKMHMNCYVNSIYHNYKLYNTDPLINNLFNNIKIIPKKIIIKKEKIIINKKINSLNDLIQLINEYPIIPNIKYNIDIYKLHNIKDLLIELNNMIGLHNIKNNILDQLLFYIQNLHLNNNIDYMHTVLYGSPGTGKTEIAKIIGNIFCKLGILKKGTFRKVVRSDLIAGYLGQTAIKTSKVIEESLGGVLFIDEAYALGNSEKRDSFAKECIDTICEGLSNHKDNLMVIIAGYEEELNNCFFSFNQGLKSRFPWVFKTDKYLYDDLKNIFIKKVNDVNWKIKIEDDLIDDFFKNNINMFPYYGRDIEIFFFKCKITHSRRVFCQNTASKTILNITDLENGLELFIGHKSKDNDINKNIIHSMYT